MKTIFLFVLDDLQIGCIIFFAGFFFSISEFLFYRKNKIIIWFVASLSNIFQP